jgi:DNA-binding transcriptional MerR regulator
MNLFLATGVAAAALLSSSWTRSTLYGKHQCKNVGFVLTTAVAHGKIIKLYLNDALEGGALMARPIDLARAVGVSSQTIRLYERVGFLPPAERTPTGQRLFGPRHMQAIQAARVMIAGYGWERALEIMRAAHQGDLAATMAGVDARHAALAQRRQQIDEVLTALRALRWMEAEQEAPVPTRRGLPALTVGEAARQVGVRPSAIRFWETQGLLQPDRDCESRYRRYRPEHLRRLHMIVLLRNGGYGFEAIRSLLAEISAGAPEQALAAIEGRREELLAASRRCMAATAALWEYLQDWPLA